MSDSLFIQLGDQKRVSFPALAGTATLKNATGVELFYLLNGDWQQLRVGTTVQTPFSYDLLTIKAVLTGLHEVALEIRPDAAPETATTVKVAVARVAMAIDSNRDGSLDYGDPGRDNWVWERGHPGAVLIVNNDKDISDSKPAPGQRSEWSELAILPLELSQVPAGATLHLHATPDAARRFAVYEYASDNTYRRVLGRELDSEDYISQSPPLPLTGGKYFVEAREYPGPFFEGLITIELYLLSDGAPIARDRVVFRTAPWIMTPNTLPVVKVFTCEVRDANDAPNELFLEGLRTALVEAKVPLHVIPDEDHLGDRWIQDEVEFGYAQGATHFIPVAFDSPRDRQLDGFPEKHCLDPIWDTSK